mgnify:CR=1 FL=1
MCLLSVTELTHSTVIEIGNALTSSRTTTIVQMGIVHFVAMAQWSGMTNVTMISLFAMVWLQYQVENRDRLAVLQLGNRHIKVLEEMIYFILSL